MGLRQDRGRLNHQCAVGASLTAFTTSDPLNQFFIVDEPMPYFLILVARLSAGQLSPDALSTPLPDSHVVADARAIRHCHNTR
jgi:hypothetical protein